MSVPSREGARWRVRRGGLKIRGVRWEPYSVEGTGSTNALWKGIGDGCDWLLKWYRYPEPGVHPEPEVAEFLDLNGCVAGAGFGGRLDLVRNGMWETAAFVQPWVNGVSLWRRALDEFRTGGRSDLCRSVGESVGGLHAALASGEEGSGFESEPWERRDLSAWVGRVETGVELLILDLERALAEGSDLGQVPVSGLLQNGGALLRQKASGLASLNARGLKSRVHGDLHLGQVLERHAAPHGGRFCVVDFEGEPLRPLLERRALDLPLRDVAGMWRSFAYAAAVTGAGGDLLHRWREDFMDGWSRHMSLPEGDWRGMLEGFAWEKAVYEALYELRHRPDWLWIPLSELQKGISESENR